jgi:hypothetical protein
MGRNDFFLDSGIIYGHADFSDKIWHKPCESHFKKYPRSGHNYYSVKRVIDREIYTVSKRRKETGFIKSDRMMRNIIKIAKALFYTNEIKNVDYINIKKDIYFKLYKIIYDFLMKRKADHNQKDRDAHLLTNAFLWDMENRELHHPHFVTIDEKDIKRNETALIDEARVCLGNFPCLCFCLIPKQAS